MLGTKAFLGYGSGSNTYGANKKSNERGESLDKHRAEAEELQPGSHGQQGPIPSQKNPQMLPRFQLHSQFATLVAKA
jgi:hypothetical protein